MSSKAGDANGRSRKTARRASSSRGPKPPKGPSDGDLFDLLRTDFGVGDWDESTSEQPYWQWRATEVAKVRRVRESRQVTVANLMLAAAYCKACGYDVRDATWLYRHIRDAIRWQKASALEQPSQLDTQITTAVTTAYNAGDMEWVGRLTRAQGTSSQSEVLAAWQAR